MPNSVMPDSVMLNSYFMLYLIPLYHFPLYLIPDCPLECYNRFLFSVIPDSIISDSVIPDSCFDIPDSVMPNSVIPDSCFACYNRFRYTRFPAPVFSSQSVVLSRIGFRVDPTSDSPQLPLPVWLAEARSRVSLAMLLRPPSQKRADFPAGLAD